jgi:hypothetical protein
VCVSVYSLFHRHHLEHILASALLSWPQDDWLRRAELAVQKGEDDLAKEALRRRKSYQVGYLCGCACMVAGGAATAASACWGALPLQVVNGDAS